MSGYIGQNRRQNVDRRQQIEYLQGVVDTPLHRIAPSDVNRVERLTHNPDGEVRKSAIVTLQIIGYY